MNVFLENKKMSLTLNRLSLDVIVTLSLKCQIDNNHAKNHQKNHFCQHDILVTQLLLQKIT
jgi:hypothetical protein